MPPRYRSISHYTPIILLAFLGSLMASPTTIAEVVAGDQPQIVLTESEKKTLTQGDTSQISSLRPRFVTLLNGALPGESRELILSRLTNEGSRCSDPAEKSMSDWLHGLCKKWISEPPIVGRRLEHSNLVLDDSHRFRMAYLNPIPREDNKVGPEQERRLMALVAGLPGTAQQEMRTLATELVRRDIAVLTAKQWTHPKHTKFLIELHLNDNEGTDYLLVVDGQEMVDVKVPERFLGQHEHNDIVEVSDLDQDGALEFWWAENYRHCNGDESDLQRESLLSGDFRAMSL